MDFITSKEAGKILNCSDVWIRELLNRKEIVGQKITPRQWIIEKQSVLNFKNKREIEKYQKKLV